MTSRRERIYRRQRQRRKKRLVRAVSIIILTIVVLLLLGAAYMHVPEVKAYEYQTCRTLWELADRHCPDEMDKREYVAEVMELNAMESCTVEPSRLYMVPVYE